jgi:hypothetical protein
MKALKIAIAVLVMIVTICMVPTVQRKETPAKETPAYISSAEISMGMPYSAIVAFRKQLGN